MPPQVTFVVPCYKLAHLLPDCVSSILAQTYQDYEILIMDDCSPDETPRVARSFTDPRVEHIRNEPNLGHLRNYNKGIELAKGKYIWLISADDCLRSPDVLRRYVKLLDANPEIGYVFCSAMRLEDGEVKELLNYSVQSPNDEVMDGRRFLRRLIYANTVVAPSAMARKECYEKVSMFPLNMPWGGDWYLWCVFALRYDVAYFAEPMVCYRRHPLSMTNHLMNDHIDSCSGEDIELPWIIKKEAKKLGYESVVKHCRRAIAREYGRTMATQRYTTGNCDMSVETFESSLRKHASDNREYRWIEARAYAVMGDHYYWQREYSKAQESYLQALNKGQWMPKALAHYLLLRSGNLGIRARQSLGALRRMVSRKAAE